MSRVGSILLLLCVVGCAHRPPAGPEVPPRLAPKTEQAGSVPAAEPHLDSRSASAAGHAESRTATASSPTATHDSLRALQRAADSAADARALEQLANAHPPDSVRALLPPESSAAPGTAVTWDIDVSTFSDQDRVRYYVDFFQGRSRDRMAIWLKRMPRYEPLIRSKLREYGLPGDLMYLALIESGFSSTAVSTARAVGMWQFMKGTAKLFGLRVDGWVDERRDPFRATDAAARYLANLTARFGSHFLAAAAYDAGPGKVARGLQRLPERDTDDDSSTVFSDAAFFQLSDTRFLRRETKDYVPKLLAAAIIAKEPTRYGFAAIDPTPPMPDSLIVPDATGLDVIARVSGASLDEIRDLNPQYIRLVTPPGTPSMVRVPAGAGEATARAVAALPPEERVPFLEHRTRRGETLQLVAARYHVKVAALVSANPELSKTKRTLPPGRVVVVPVRGVLPKSLPDDEPRSRRVVARYHVVGSGETLGEIADNFGVSERQLKSWNHLAKHAKLRAGSRLRVSPPTGPPRSNSSRRSTKRKAHPAPKTKA